MKFSLKHCYCCVNHDYTKISSGMPPFEGLSLGISLTDLDNLSTLVLYVENNCMLNGTYQILSYGVLSTLVFIC